MNSTNSVWNNNDAEHLHPLPERDPTTYRAQLRDDILRGVVALVLLTALGMGLAVYTKHDLGKWHIQVFSFFVMVGIVSAYQLIRGGYDRYHARQEKYEYRQGCVSFYYALQPNGELIFTSLLHEEREPNHTLLQLLVTSYVQEYSVMPSWILWASVKQGNKSVRLMRVVSMSPGYAFAEYVLPVYWGPGDWMFHQDRTRFGTTPQAILCHAEVFAYRPSDWEFVPYLLTLVKSAQDDLAQALKHGPESLLPHVPSAPSAEQASPAA